MAINSQELQGQWNQVRGQVKEKWGQLTDDDLQIQGGNVDQLVGRIQQKTGEAREAIESFLGNLTANSSAALSQAGERLREGYGQAADRARAGYDQVEDIVRHKPGQSVATAFGVGIVVGVVVGLALRGR